MTDSRPIDTTTPPSAEFKAESLSSGGITYANITEWDDSDKKILDDMVIQAEGFLTKDRRVHLTIRSREKTMSFLLFRTKDTVLLSINDFVLPLRDFLNIKHMRPVYRKPRANNDLRVVPTYEGVRCNKSFTIPSADIKILIRAMLYFSEHYDDVVPDTTTKKGWFC